MNDFLIDMAFSTIISLIKGIKGPEKKAKFRAVFRKVNTLIAGVYKDDAEFRGAWE